MIKLELINYVYNAYLRKNTEEKKKFNPVESNHGNGPTGHKKIVC